MPKSKKLYFIFNPKAGKMEVKRNLFAIVDRFVAAGFEVAVHPTQDENDAYRTVRKQAGKFDYLVCAGGDGTLSQVISGLMDCKKRPVLGFIPTGTTNDFAVTLGLPKDMMEAVETIISGRKVAVDIGRFNDQYFSYVAAFGLFTDLTYDTSQGLKNVFGYAAYLLEGIKRLGNVRTYRCMIQQNGEDVEGDFILGIISNSISLGGFQGLSSNVQLDDGEFEGLFVTQPQGIGELNQIIQSLLRGENLSDCLRFFRISRVEIELTDEIHWTLDGEYGGSPSRVVIQNIQRAIEIMIPDGAMELLSTDDPVTE